MAPNDRFEASILTVTYSVNCMIHTSIHFIMITDEWNTQQYDALPSNHIVTTWFSDAPPLVGLSQDQVFYVSRYGNSSFLY